MYNTTKDSCFSPVHPEGGFMSNDQRYKKFPFFLRGKSHYTLWRTFPYSSILSKTEIETPHTNLCSLQSMSHSLHQFRTHLVHFILHHCWYLTCRQYPLSTIQRSFQKTHRSENFPESYYYKTFLTPPFTKSYPPDCQSTRLIATEAVLHWMSTNQRSMGHRSDSSHSLRQTTKSKNRLQPQKAR